MRLGSPLGTRDKTQEVTANRASQPDARASPSILLLDGETTHALNVVRCLSLVRGLRIHVLSRRARVPLRFSRTTASFHLWPGLDAIGSTETVGAFARELGVDLCFAVGEHAMEYVARFRASLPVDCLPAPSTEALRITLDKWRLSEFLREHALPQPATTGGTPNGAPPAIPADFRFPVLVKPRSGGNGAGIRRFTDRAQLLRDWRLHGLDESYIVQTELFGSDVDCSVLCIDGEVLAYTIQRGFTPISSFRPPGGVQFIHDERVIALVRELMRALAWSGVAHIDLRYDRDSKDVKIIEVNPRFWGSVLGSLHAGVNFPHLACEVALGRTLGSPQYRECRYVAGATAVSLWKSGRLRAASSGFALSDTVFRYAWRDPLPTLLEPFLAG